LIAGGRYHDFDFARLELLKALAARDRVRVAAASSYADLEALERASFLVTYTCDIVPDAAGTRRIEAFLRRGGRWLALHGTNSVLAQNEAGRWFAPADSTGFMALLGSQFAAHPPIAPYDVKVVRGDDPLTEGIGDFSVEGGDELYYLRVFEPLEVLLDAGSQGPAKGFVERDWPDARHPVLYRKPVGEGGIVFFSLGHRRGRYDMAPLIDDYPAVERGAWEVPVYRRILERCIAWAIGD
jgi:hypothetical protein